MLLCAILITTVFGLSVAQNMTTKLFSCDKIPIDFPIDCKNEYEISSGNTSLVTVRNCHFDCHTPFGKTDGKTAVTLNKCVEFTMKIIYPQPFREETFRYECDPSPEASLSSTGLIIGVVVIVVVVVAVLALVGVIVFCLTGKRRGYNPGQAERPAQQQDNV
ncbi:hypothetical protein WMY93_030570 [Mugilogobius chulae]|uniref:Uncharacterized protein n=1 Tax=Mugilogobius chulae TaxID=88201 RepID=A0AAW0MHE2_9GOBI